MIVLIGEDGGDVTSRLEDGLRLVPHLNNTLLLASPSEFESSSNPAAYEISGLSSDGIVIKADPQIEEVTASNSLCCLCTRLRWHFHQKDLNFILRIFFRYKGEGLSTWYAAAYMSKLVNSSSLQSWKCQLIGMS